MRNDLNIILNYIIVTIANEHVGVHFFQQFSRVRLLVHCFFTENKDFKAYETLRVMTVYYFKYIYIYIMNIKITHPSKDQEN